MFEDIQQCEREKRTIDTPIVGFPLKNETIREVPPEGAVLVGFQVGYGKFINQPTINAFRAIYMTKNGEKLGAWVGNPPAATLVTRAKDGYVVTGAEIAQRPWLSTALALDLPSWRMADSIAMTNTTAIGWEAKEANPASSPPATSLSSARPTIWATKEHPWPSASSEPNFLDLYGQRFTAMELHTLKLSVTEKDLNDLLRKYLPKDLEIDDLKVKLSDQGVHVTGVYPFFISVRFETIWELGVEAGQATARLASFKAMGVPGNIFKSSVIKVVEDIAKQESWIRIVGDRFFADLELGCAKYAIAARLHLKSIVVTPGQLLVEAGH